MQAESATTKLDNLCESTHFLAFGSPLEGYGERFVKFSDKEEELKWNEGDSYFGEWSKPTGEPHGRGIRF